MKLKLKSVALLIMAVSIIGAAFSFAEDQSKFEQSVEAVIAAIAKAEKGNEFEWPPSSTFNESTYNTYSVVARGNPFSKNSGDVKIVDGITEHRYLGKSLLNRNVKLTNPNYPNDEDPTEPLHTWNWINVIDNSKENSIYEYFQDDEELKKKYEAAIMITLEERFGELFDPDEENNSIENYFNRAIVLQPMTDYSRGYIQFRHIKDDGVEWYVTIVTPVASDPRLMAYFMNSETPEPIPSGDASEGDLPDDLLISEMRAFRYPANSNVTAYVTVENDFETEMTSLVDFSVPGLTSQSKEVTIAPGELTLLEFDFQTASAGTKTMVAEVNKDKSITEKSYDNNYYEQDIEIYSTGFIDGGCSNGSNKVRWTETDSRLEKRTKTKTVKKVVDGKVTRKKKTITFYVRVYYDFVYEASVNLSMNVYDDTGSNASKGKNIGNSFTTKSGYGFFLEPVSTVSYRQVSGKWTREPSRKPSAANKCVLYMPWTIPNKDYRGEKQTPQSSQITFERTSTSGYTSYFNLPKNPISKYGYRKAYTFVDLEDGSYNYKVTVYADAPYRDICATFTGTVKISGTMHDDYRVY